jgi:hypothetical protein
MMNTPRIMRVGPIGQTARLALAILEVFQPRVQTPSTRSKASF